MKRTHMITAVVSLMVFAFALNVEARPNRGHKGHKQGGEMMVRLCEKLDLTDKQQAEVKKLTDDLKVESKDLREKLQAAKKEMRQLWKAENPNEDKIIAQIEKMSAIQLELKKLRAELKLDIFALLTPEQKAKADELREQRKEFRKDKKAKRGRGYAAKGERSFRGGPTTEATF